MAATALPQTSSNVDHLHMKQPAALAVMVVQDQARTLYAHGKGGLTMSAIVSLLLSLMVVTPANHALVAGWLCAMAIVLAVRGFDLLILYPKRRQSSEDGPADIRRYAAGVGAAALLWVAFPPLFFATMTQTSRAGSAVILAAMAGGSPIMLGAVLSVAIGYCLSLILPFSLLLLFLPGRVNATLGTLGLTDALVMTWLCKVLHDRVLAYMRLARSHQLLTEEALVQQSRTEAAQFALQAANQTLEARVEDRTADLQREILERKSYAIALERLASIDPLTGLLNRATLANRLDAALARASWSAISLAVLFLDLDGFKHINDVQGHEVGDHVLKAVAGRITQCCVGAHAAAWHVARWGGDEFVIVATGLRDEATIAATAQAILTALSDPIELTDLKPGAASVRLGVTIGVALAPAHGTTQDTLIRSADNAMYSGKKQGGGRVVIFNQLLARQISERRLIEQGLRSAPHDGALALHYQPIINALTGRCDLMEALLRWTHPSLGAVGPNIFIPIAEQSEEIIAIGRFVLREACTAAMRWPGEPQPSVAVNISIAQILSGHLLADVQVALDESGLPVQRLELEITESMFIADHDRVMPVLEALRARGIHLALDDFGTGFSSLARLATLPIDTIKIDRAFVQQEDERGLAMIRAMLLIARALRLEVTAEGVETENQVVTMKALGADRLQGYRLARPMQAASVAEWLASHAADLRQA